MNEVSVDMAFIYRMAHKFIPHMADQFADMSHTMSSVHTTFGEMGEAEEDWQLLTGVVQTAMAECSTYLGFTAKTLASAGRDFDKTDGDNAEHLKWKSVVPERVEPAFPDAEPEYTYTTNYGY